MQSPEKYRSEFPITKRYTVLNHAAISPIPCRVSNAIKSLLQELSHCGIGCYPRWVKRIEEVRKLFSGLINSDSHEIAFVGNTSEGLSIIAAGLQWKRGDAVIIPESDFPSNVYPWVNLKRKGVKTIRFQKKGNHFGPGDIEKSLIPGARLVSVSSVDFVSGFRCDLEAIGELCQRKGLLFCVDGIQSLGLVPMDVKKYRIHFLAAGGHKWLLSTMGCGGIFISKDVDHLLHPERVGWKSVSDEEDFFRLRLDLKPAALRFEPGTMNVAGVYALGAAMELLLEVGIENIFRRVLGIIDLLYEGLRARKIQIITPMGHGERSGILSLIPPADPESLYRFFIKKRIMVSLRRDVIRLSPHFYNNQDDVARFLQALDSYGVTRLLGF